VHRHLLVLVLWHLLISLVRCMLCTNHACTSSSPSSLIICTIPLLGFPPVACAPTGRCDDESGAATATAAPAAALAALHGCQNAFADVETQIRHEEFQQQRKADEEQDRVVNRMMVPRPRASAVNDCMASLSPAESLQRKKQDDAWLEAHRVLKAQAAFRSLYFNTKFDDECRAALEAKGVNQRRSTSFLGSRWRRHIALMVTSNTMELCRVPILCPFLSAVLWTHCRLCHQLW
jgi:hypothetical protein